MTQRSGAGRPVIGVDVERRVPGAERAVERVVLVDGDDREVGTEEKLAAHRAGLLHRAFSIFVVNGAGELLLQRRSLAKYHSAGRWSNACCGHPRPREALEAAAHRRLREEMGFDCGLRLLPPFRYRAPLEDGLVENEIDHLLIGEWEGDPAPDPEEVADWRWVEPGWLGQRIAAHPAEFTAWLRLIVAGRPGLLARGAAGGP